MQDMSMKRAWVLKSGIRARNSAGPAPVETAGSDGSSHHAWVLRRIAIGVVTLVFVSIIVFAATQGAAGHAARQISAGIRAVRHFAHWSTNWLNQSIVSQYLTWAGHIVTGNLGTSYTENTPVSKVIGPAVANSAVLVVLTAVIAIILSILLGVAAAARRDGLVDHVFSAYVFVFTAVPEFIVGVLLVMLLATTVFHVLPAVSLIPPGSGALSRPNVYILPVATLVIAIVPYLGRLVRGSMIDVLESEYVRMARLKGMRERRILFRHALPNALVPAIQGIAIAIGYLAGESWPSSSCLGSRGWARHCFRRFRNATSP